MTRPVLNRLLTLEDPVRSPDGAGGFDVTWTTLGALWAGIKPGTGRERAGRGGATMSRVPVRITVRAAPMGAPSRPRPEQRFRDGDRVYHILAVAEADPGARYLICHAEEETVA